MADHQQLGQSGPEYADQIAGERLVERQRWVEDGFLKGPRKGQSDPRRSEPDSMKAPEDFNKKKNSDSKPKEGSRETSDHGKNKHKDKVKGKEREKEKEKEVEKDRDKEPTEVEGSSTTTNKSTTRMIPYVLVNPPPADFAVGPIVEKEIEEEVRKSYRLQSNVERENLVKDVVARVLDQPVEGISLRDFLGTSKALRDAVKAEVAQKRVPVAPKATIEEVVDEEAVPPRPKTNRRLYSVKQQTVLEWLPPFQVFVQEQEEGGIPKGAYIVSDPVSQYLNEGGDPNRTKEIFVASESQQLRAVYPRINNTGEAECILDGGSQIVSMAHTVATDLGLTWDPDIRIRMQSANKGVDWTLGLAKNVPFALGPVTVYLQVHIIRDPAYQVLLGRPFDTLTESNVQNFVDGMQTITITDPNSGKRCTIPTYERGKPRSVQEQSTAGVDFQHDSRN